MDSWPPQASSCLPLSRGGIWPPRCMRAHHVPGGGCSPGEGTPPVVDGVMVSHGSSTYLKPSVMDTATTHILACVEPPSGVHVRAPLPRSAADHPISSRCLPHRYDACMSLHTQRCSCRGRYHTGIGGEELSGLPSIQNVLPLKPRAPLRMTQEFPTRVWRRYPAVYYPITCMRLLYETTHTHAFHLAVRLELSIQQPLD